MGNLETAKLALMIAKEINHEAKQLPLKIGNEPIKGQSQIDRRDIFLALANISPNLASSYAQVKQDIQDNRRVSWAGTAHEIREVLANLLRTLAPDGKVTTQPWFRSESRDGKPTHKQRAKYILQIKGSNSAQTEVVGKVEMLDERIADLVRSIYSRGSVAAHTYEERKEVIRILRYFEAFAQDLLDI